MTDILNCNHVSPTIQTVKLNGNDNTFTLNDKTIQQLLNKLNEGTETIMNLRSLLTYKTAELNELVHQLELIDQVLDNVEHGTEQIELVLKDVFHVGQEKLLDAEATLDSAIKSACSLYSIDLKPTQVDKPSMVIVNKINLLLNGLNIDSASFWNQSDDIQNTKSLTKIANDLQLAKNISSTIKNDTKHRSITLKNDTLPLEQIKKMGEKIKSQIELYKSYTRNAPLLVNGGKEDVMALLDREDKIISKKMARLNTTSTVNITTAPSKKKRQITMTTVHNNNKCITESTIIPSTTTMTHTHKQSSSLESISRHTSSSKAKSKEPKRLQQSQQQQQGPGSTLRLRQMLAKRNLPAKVQVRQITV